MFLLLASAVVASAALIYWFIARTDSNWSLLWAELFGKSPAVLKGKVAWVTGAGSGLGRAITIELAKRGARVVLSDIDASAMDDVKYTIVSEAGLTDDDILLLPMDITKFETHDASFKKVLDKFGHLDILVNCAGRSQSAHFQDIDIEVHKALFDINCFSHINLTKCVLPHWLERRTGHAVVLSSVCGKIGVPYSATYNASKAALHGFYDCLWSEVYNKGIKITMVCPGPVATPIRQKCFTGKPGEVMRIPPSEQEVKMSPSRAAKLILIGVANKLDEIWIGPQPFISYLYLGQYLPGTFRKYIVPVIFEPSKIASLRDGKGNY
ncbi:dehydrogenase/reductase SDR family member 7-like [Ornithodoros turicata]|uniref:dehydrogenase/reductase SDR family member 7-like n=1 Tax=Ornithodoros turicata TaxID=34597 RepID=UPI0031387B31